MNTITIGLDLAKNVFQVHGVDANGKVTIRKKLHRAEVLSFLGSLPACLVGMEACATAHYWAREPDVDPPSEKRASLEPMTF